MENTSNSYQDSLDQLESESIFIFREVIAQCESPVLLYSVGKDSSVLLRLAQKAYFPAKIPFPILHIDTGYKFAEMYEFRDSFVPSVGGRLQVYRNEDAISAGTSPQGIGTQRCCGLLKTQALLSAIKMGSFDAAIGGARRDEERSRAKERIFSIRNEFGQWDPRCQRPELWNQFNAALLPGNTMRVFPLSNWTELDIWLYIKRENIPIVPLYFAKERPMIVRGEQLIAFDKHTQLRAGEAPQEVMCRYRSLGCIPCTGAVRSDATTLDQIINEMFNVRTSERATRVIDHDSDGSMETKKREGYF